MFRTKRRIVLFIAAFLAVVGVILYLALSGGAPTAIAPNGRKVTIEKVTFGTHHRFTQGKWWLRLLKPVMGNRWAAQRGCYETRFTNDTPALMVWTRWEGIGPLNPAAVEATVLDERGTESELITYRWYTPADSRAASAYVAWSVNNFPRRNANVRLRFYDRDRRYVATQAVEIAISNPARKRIAEWRGSELPLVVKTNNTAFVLTSVQQTSNALWRLEFFVRTNGQQDVSWQVGGVTASSASGNLFGTHSNLPVRSVTNLTFQLRGALWPEEPVWRFATDFYRSADFQPNELWTLTNIAIPSRALPFRLSTNLFSYPGHPIELQLENIPPTIAYPPPAMRRNATISVQFEANAHLFLVAATDEQGREVKTEVHLGAPRRVYLFSLAIPSDAQALNLSFAIRRPILVAFDVVESRLKRVVAGE